jgi:hypothetical protein
VVGRADSRGRRHLALAASANATDTWSGEQHELWIALAGLNIIAPTVILYTAIWRRWPLTNPHGHHHQSQQALVNPAQRRGKRMSVLFCPGRPIDRSPSM